MLEVVHPGTEEPLVSYILQCYRHERFAAEAARSVLGQTYEPLEIFLSDDSSPDKTFQVLTDLARSYQGPHRVILHRSEQNQDTLACLNGVIPNLKGRFIFWMSGDDVAEPDQVESLTRAWEEGGCAGVWSNYWNIDQDSSCHGLGFPTLPVCPLDLNDYASGRFLDFGHGGLLGFTRQALDQFGPMPAHIGNRGAEHHLGFRTAVLGPKRYLSRPHLRKRDHPDRLTIGCNTRDRQSDAVEMHARQIEVRLQILTSFRHYLSIPGLILPDADRERVDQGLLRQIACETRRLLEYRAFSQRRAKAAEPESPRFAHSGLLYPPNGMAFVRDGPGPFNILAAECKYFAVSHELGAIEPYGLRNGLYPGVRSAWSELELMELMEQKSD